MNERLKPGETCTACGFHKPKNGRPRAFDYERARKLSKKYSLREVAEKLGVTHGAVQAALKKGKSK